MNCPRCQNSLEAATPLSKKGRQTPRAGDYSVCLVCAQPLRVTATGLEALDVETIPEVHRRQLEKVQWRVLSAADVMDANRMKRLLDTLLDVEGKILVIRRELDCIGRVTKVELGMDSDLHEALLARDYSAALDVAKGHA